MILNKYDSISLLESLAKKANSLDQMKFVLEEVNRINKSSDDIYELLKLKEIHNILEHKIIKLRFEIRNGK